MGTAKKAPTPPLVRNHLINWHIILAKLFQLNVITPVSVENQMSYTSE
jgi:hypothetical protein